MADHAAAPAPSGDPDDTFSKLLLRNARLRGARPASREKEYGIWQTWSWAEVEREVRALSCGLAALGLKRGDRVAIVGDNRPRLYWTMVAAQAVGGVPVPVYQDAVADEMKYVLDHAEVRFVVAEDQEQVDKVLAVREFCPRIDTIVFCDPRGMRHYDQPFLRQRAVPMTRPIPASTRPRSPRARAATSPSCSTPRARRARPRAAC
jgi:long-chain acyl-CoA synthetase